MKNKRTDDYLASGNTEEGFITELEELIERTSYQIVEPSDITLFSYHRTEDKEIEGEPEYVKRMYYFYKLNRASMNKFEENNIGFTETPLAVKFKRWTKTEGNDFFEGIIDGTGLLIAYNDENGNIHYNGVSNYGFMTLCKRADVKGRHIRKKGLLRDIFIADGLLPKDKRDFDDYSDICDDSLANEKIKMAIRYNLGTKSDGTKVRKEIGNVIGFFSESYNEDGMKLFLELYKAISKDRSLGEPKLTYWEINQGYSTVFVEFPEAGNEFQKKYNLSKMMIPGIKIITSECGMSSLTISGTYRFEEEKDIIIVNDYSRNHRGKVSVNEIMREVRSKIFKKLENYAKTVSNLSNNQLGEFDITTEVGRQENYIAICNAIERGFEKLAIDHIIGVKRTKLMKKYILNKTDNTVLYSYYDIAKMFFELKKYINEVCGKGALGKTANDSLERELAKIASVRFKK